MEFSKYVFWSHVNKVFKILSDTYISNCSITLNKHLFQRNDKEKEPLFVQLQRSHIINIILSHCCTEALNLIEYPGAKSSLEETELRQEKEARVPCIEPAEASGVRAGRFKALITEEAPRAPNQT